jgi:hypothetical protein
MLMVDAVTIRPCRPAETLVTTEESENHRDMEADEEKRTFMETSKAEKSVPMIARKDEAVIGKFERRMREQFKQKNGQAE